MNKRTAFPLLFLLAVGAVFLSTLGAFPKAAGAAEYTIRLGTAAPPAHPLTRANFEFKKYLEERSNGRIEVKVLHSAQLGGVRENIEMESILRVIWPYILLGIALLFLVAFVPDITLVVPRLLGYP